MAMANIYITYVEKQYAFLKIWGQTDRNTPIVIERNLVQYRPQFESGINIPSYESLQVGQPLCAKYGGDDMYYRAKITKILNHGLIEVQFLDYGNKEVVPYINTRTLTNNILTIAPQAKDFILAQATIPAVNDQLINRINNEIRYLDMQYTEIMRVGPFPVIQLFLNGVDLTAHLSTHQLVHPIPLATQQMMLSSYISPMPPVQLSPIPLRIPQQLPVVQSLTPPPAASSPQALVSYKGHVLEPGTEHAIYVSYVTDGPLQFSVQLQKMESALAKLMGELNTMVLHPIEDNVLPGLVCVARCLEDEYICRAVVTSIIDGQFKVFYVDFGNIEVIPFENLYQIPFKYVIPKVMAMRFSLAGLEKSNVTLEMKCAFKDFVANKKLRMKIVPSPKRMAVQTCELYDENNLNVLDVLRRVAMLSYPEPLNLNRGLSQDVHVSFVYGCSKFFVQLKNKEEELKKLMSTMQDCYTEKMGFEGSVKEGAPIVALYEDDGQWYRAQIVKVQNGRTALVRYIDYGNEAVVELANLKKPLPEHITVLRPQAIECCLNGYQNMEEDKERDNLLEELILEQDFSMKVADLQENRLLVELFDASKYNVSSLLLEKIANARAQVSPLLVQDGLRVEHKKKAIEQHDRREAWRSPRSDRDSQQNNFWNGDSKQQGRENLYDRRNDHFGGQKSHGDAPSGRFDISRRLRRNSGESLGDGSEKNADFNNRDKRSGKNFGKKSEGEKHRGGNWEEPRGGRPQNKWGNKDRGSPNDWRASNQHQFKKGQAEHHYKSGSEKSWSDGSDSNKQRRRTSSKNDYKPRSNKRVEFSNNGDNWNGGGAEEQLSWDISSVSDLPDTAPSDAKFTSLVVTGQTENVAISWFYNPGHFYCQLEKYQNEFRQMMEDIQTVYCNRKPFRAAIGSPVLGVFPEDKVLYRAEILDINGNQYKLRFVDFGNISTTREVYPIERKYMELPAQAISCRLKDLTPFEHNWGNIEKFEPFFNKEKYSCTFVAVENECYLVNLFAENSLSIGDGLVSAGLAKTIDPSAQIELAGLIGQQLRVTLSKIISLSDFTAVTTQRDVSLPCSAHNLETATQMFVDNLKEQLDKPVIIYIDNLVDYRFEVTVYDIDGNKLQLIDPDEGSYESIDPFCPFPVLYSTLNGWVSHVTPTTIFVQPSGFEDTLSQMLDQLYEEYEGSILETPIVPEPNCYYIVHSSDANWYRAKVVSVDDDAVVVMFVDYGNTEKVAFTEVRKMEKKHMDLHMLAIEVLISESTEELFEKEITLSLSYTDNGWAGVIIGDGSEEKPEAVESTTSEMVSSDCLTVYTTDVAVNETYQLESQETTSKHDTPFETAGINVIVSHVDSPTEFYLQLSEAIDSVTKLQEGLQNVVGTLQILENPSAGALCAAQYSVDQKWYRAQVLDADDDITTVRFVDYGNTDVLDKSSAQVKTLTPELLTTEQHARRCSLNVQPVEEEWSTAALERFAALTDSEKFVAKIISQDEKTTFVELYSDGKNIAEILIDEQFAKKVEEVHDKKVATAFVSHMNSPSEFWIQFESSVGDLEWISEELMNAESFPELIDFNPGSLCAAIFPEDDQWYRARILSNTVAGLEVLFIDYGNSCTCQTVRALPEDLVMMPPMALKSSLQKPSGVGQWSPTSIEKFKEISADGATIFNVRKLSTGETSVVELTIDGKDVSLMLLPKTLDCFVTKFESLESFNIKKNGEEEELETAFKLEALPGLQWTQESHNKFEELTDCGRTIFQVEFVTGDTVRLYINYRDIRQELGGEKSTLVVTPKKIVDELGVIATNRDEDQNSKNTKAVESLNSVVMELKTDDESSVYEKTETRLSLENEDAQDKEDVQEKAPQAVATEELNVNEKLIQKGDEVYVGVGVDPKEERTEASEQTTEVEIASLKETAILVQETDSEKAKKVVENIQVQNEELEESQIQSEISFTSEEMQELVNSLSNLSITNLTEEEIPAEDFEDSDEAAGSNLEADSGAMAHLHSEITSEVVKLVEFMHREFTSSDGCHISNKIVEETGSDDSGGYSSALTDVQYQENVDVPQVDKETLEVDEVFDDMSVSMRTAYEDEFEIAADEATLNDGSSSVIFKEIPEKEEKVSEERVLTPKMENETIKKVNTHAEPTLCNIEMGETATRRPLRFNPDERILPALLSKPLMPDESQGIVEK